MRGREAQGAWWFSRASNPLRVVERRPGWVRFPHASAIFNPQVFGDSIMSETTIACVQMDCLIGEVEANRNKMIERLREAATEGAELVIFPECALTGYCFDSLQEAEPFAEPADGQSVEALARACGEAGVHAVVGFIEKEGGAYYNAAMLVGPDGLVGTYRKVHLPFIGVDRFLTPGDRAFKVFDLPLGKVGVIICYDVSFPESARALKLLGAEIVVLPTNWPPGAWRNPEFVINARAQENHVHFAAVNRVGLERGWKFIGRTKVVDYSGDDVGEINGDTEEILYARLDLRGANNNRIINVAGAYEIDRIADRRPEFYEVITRMPTRSHTAD
jgi:predicted amidohydrolase